MERLGLVITALGLLASLLSSLTLAHHGCHSDADKEEKENGENDTGDNPNSHRDTVGLRKGEGLHVNCHC